MAALRPEDALKIQVEPTTSRSQMESPFEREEERLVEENKEKWDVYDENAVDFDDSSEDNSIFPKLVKVLKVLVYLSTFCVVLFSAVISKGSLLLMTSAIRRKRLFPICKNLSNDIFPDSDDKYVVKMSEHERYSWIWCLIFSLFVPEILTFIRSCRICIFKNYHKPRISSFLMVFMVESFHVIGLVSFVFVVLPEMHVMKALLFSNVVCFFPSILNFWQSSKAECEVKSQKRNVLNLIAMVFQGSILIWLGLTVHEKLNHTGPRAIVFGDPDVWAVISVILISLTWWENYVDEESPSFLAKVKDDIEKSRHFIYVFVSLWKIALILGCCLVYLFLTLENIPNFFMLKDIFVNHNITITWKVDDIPIPDNTNLKPQMILQTLSDMKSNRLLPILVSSIHVICAYVCYSCCKFVCKVCMQQFSFSLPLCLTIPLTIMHLSFMCHRKSQDPCMYSRMSPYLYWDCPKDGWQLFVVEELGYFWILWFLSQVIVTYHIWYPKCERMASTNKLFVNPMYSTILVDQSLVLNRRKFEKKEAMKIIDREEEINEVPENITTIFACATMWHETPDEMEQLLKSIMRMDAHQCSQAMIQHGFLIRNPDYYELEAHIFFDDAFVVSDEDDEKRTINSFVKDFIAAVDTAASKVYKKCSRPDPPFKVPTPYGGQLIWRLLGDSFLVVHLKDKELIRHKKRWSQVMYMYYLLGYRLEYKMCQNRNPDFSVENLRKNTFILALDGDIDFRPSAVMLLVDLMKRNRNLGAACGRIHPVGTGLMVYYQKFEYAIGHWLQKSTEHMIGCVLCSPGCFSLFRAEALLKKNTMRTYANIAKEAIEYVQFDQGEDRWLCTLLLQRGYKVEYSAASDAYTHCPETFGEFYTQRRRWAPSTMANIMDLLINYRKTVECNDNISRPYIAYQVLLMVGTILGPGTIFLMLVGAMVSAFNISNWQALTANMVPIVFFILICFHAKNDTQIFIAQIFSALYALLMMAVLVGISLQIAEDGVTSPSGIFIASMTASFVIAALAHPQEFWCVAHGVLYFLSVPSMYLLLALYSFINLHVVSWGTREVQTKKTKKQLAEEQLQAQVTVQTKTKSGGMFDWINALGNRGHQEEEEEGSISFSFANLFRCMCCTYPKPDTANLQMVKLEMALNKIDSEIKVIQNQMESTIMQKRGMRRRSSVHNIKKELKLDTLPEEAEEESEEGDDSSEAEISEQEEHTYNQVDSNIEYWLTDKAVGQSTVLRLTNLEKQFWQDLIGKYLYPLTENPDEKAKVSRQLIDLRNKVVFGVLMLNALFILIVFLLQMKKDVLHIEWPMNGKNKNITYIQALDEIRIDMEYLQLEPINLVLVFFFTLILVIQFVGMIFHRSETISHILASTTLFTYSSKDTQEINFSKLTDLLRKQGLEDDNETPLAEVKEELTVPDHPNAASSNLNIEENNRPRKFRSLSLAMEDDIVKILKKDKKFANAIRRKSKYPDAVDAMRRRSEQRMLGVTTPQSLTRPPTPLINGNVVDFQWSNQGSFRSQRRSRIIEHMIDVSDSESVNSFQMSNPPPTSSSPTPSSRSNRASSSRRTQENS